MSGNHVSSGRPSATLRDNQALETGGLWARVKTALTQRPPLTALLAGQYRRGQFVKLPNAQLAHIDRGKAHDYLLSDAHPVGRFKAAFFRALGYDQEHWQELCDALRRLAAEGEAEMDEWTEYGQKYRVEGVVTSPSGRHANVVSIWIVPRGQEVPLFITAFPGEV